MLGGVTTQRESLLWTLEEISHLVSHSGHPEETLDNIVQLIQRTFDTDVCSVYLLEPDRSTLVLAATDRPAPRQRRTHAHAAVGGAGRASSASSCGRRLSKTPRRIRDSNISARPAKIPYHSFLGVPLIDKGLLQGVLVVQTIEPRAFSADAVRMLTMAGTQLASIVSQARTLGQFVAPAHQRLEALARNLWWSWDHDTASLFRALDPGAVARARSQPDRAAPADSRRAARRARVGARAAQPHQLRVPPHAGAPDVDAHVGRAERGGALGATGRVLLGRVRPARIGADLLGRPRHPRRRPHQGGLGPRHSARRHRPLLRPGLFHAAIRS